jgi:hypothetical protein
MAASSRNSQSYEIANGVEAQTVSSSKQGGGIPDLPKFFCERCHITE